MFKQGDKHRIATAAPSPTPGRMALSDLKSQGLSAADHPDCSSLAGPHILVAEDNAMNMILIRELLRNIYPSISILQAGNGKEAIQLFESQPIDLILMDIQMPQLDGIEACKAIRAIEMRNPGAPAVPIIALTAGVVKDERDKCLAAGMNAYLSKPVSQEMLEEVLASYLSGFESAVRTMKESISSSSGQHFDAAKLLKRIYNDEELLVELVSIARKQVSQQLAELQSAIQAVDKPRILFCAHNIRGTALNMNLSLLAGIMTNIEQSTEQNPSRLQSLFVAAEEEFAIIMDLWSVYQ